MFTRVKMSAVEEIHRGVPQRKYSEEHGELPLAKNRRLCPTKNNVRYYTGILLKIEENICSRMLEDKVQFLD